MSTVVNEGKLKGGQQWIRVHGPDLEPRHAERGKANISRLADNAFKTACRTAGVEPTARQASKWNNNHGAAYKTANNISMNGFFVTK